MRRRRADKRELIPDVRYNSELVTKLINTLLKGGKKSTAQAIVYGAMDQVRVKTKADPLEALMQALDNVKPVLEVKSRRVGGANYQVPVEIAPNRQVGIALRWIVTFAQGRKGRPMLEALAGEIIDAYNNTGSAVKKREDTHKMAQANKAFAHYRW
jgi:small subunit ribosomal protein S7